ELLGHGLGQGRADVLPDFRLARVDRDPAVLADMQPGADVLGQGRSSTAAAPAPAPGWLRRGGPLFQQGQDEDPSSPRLQETATIQVEPIGQPLAKLVPLGLDLDPDLVPRCEASWLVHRRASFTACAALRMAAMIRG